MTRLCGEEERLRVGQTPRRSASSLAGAIDVDMRFSRVKQTNKFRKQHRRGNRTV